MVGYLLFFYSLDQSCFLVSANHSFNESTVRKVFEVSFAGPIVQNIVALFVKPSMHKRMLAPVFLNHAVVPSLDLLTSTKSFSRTTNLNL